MNNVAKVLLALVAASLIMGTLNAQQMKKSSPDGAAVYIASPANGAVVPGTFTVVFALSGMGVAPAGIERDNTGHHHLLVDGQRLPDLNAPLGDAVTHFGGGQTQTTVTLPPGQHTLQLIFADHLHLPHEPPVVSAAVTVTVAN
jgi:hypothetical protein